MKIEFRKSFAGDLKKIKKNKALLEKVRRIIDEVEKSAAPEDIRNLKKIKAEGNFFRIRTGDYRIGIVIENDTVRFVRILHRRDVYRYFP